MKAKSHEDRDFSQANPGDECTLAFGTTRQDLIDPYLLFDATLGLFLAIAVAREIPSEIPWQNLLTLSLLWGEIYLLSSCL